MNFDCPLNEVLCTFECVWVLASSEMAFLSLWWAAHYDASYGDCLAFSVAENKQLQFLKFLIVTGV